MELVILKYLIKKLSDYPRKENQDFFVMNAMQVIMMNKLTGEIEE
jgi:hypothetical protein